MFTGGEGCPVVPFLGYDFIHRIEALMEKRLQLARGHLLMGVLPMAAATSVSVFPERISSDPNVRRRLAGVMQTGSSPGRFSRVSPRGTRGYHLPQTRDAAGGRRGGSGQGSLPVPRPRRSHLDTRPGAR